MGCVCDSERFVLLSVLPWIAYAAMHRSLLLFAMSTNPQLRLHAQPTIAPVEPPFPSCKRCAPNLPGSLTRSLSRRLGVDATTAMRVALLYGDMEWLAGGGTQLRYSASDYARRQGLHRHTVAADLRRLVEIRAIQITHDSCNAACIQLQGLDVVEAAMQEASPVELIDTPVDANATPLSLPSTPPCRYEHQPPVDPIDNPLSSASTTLEKTSKTLEKKKREKAEPSPHPQSQEPDQNQQPDPPQGSQQPDQPSAVAVPSPRKLAVQQEISRPTPEAVAPKASAAAELLSAVLAIYRSHKPAEWPAPGALTLTSGRRARLQKALAHAGSPEALLQRLRTALEQVPPWFRRTYPQRPDGSRRPAHQFVDLLFRATASESDCGPEAWHLFAWSEAGARGPGQTGGMDGTAQGHSAPETDLQKAQRLFLWDSGVWRAQGREALLLSIHEKRELALLLEAHGQGIPGTAERQFAEVEAPPAEPPEQPPAAVSAQAHRPRPGLWRQQPTQSAPGAPTVIVHRSPRQPTHPGHTQPQASGSQAS
jgi:hypothetical protein